MIARNGITSPRKRSIVARVPMEEHPPKLSTGPEKVRVTPLHASFYERQIQAPASVTGRIAPSPSTRPATLFPLRTLVLAASFKEISQPWEAK